MKRPEKLILHIVLGIAAAITISPIVWMLSVSLMPAGYSGTYPPPFFPKEVTFEHYRDLFERLNLARYMINSTAISVSVTFISLLLNSMAGYAFAKYKFKGRDKLFRVLIAGMVIPAQVTMLPLFLMLNKMGFINTYIGVMIPYMTTIFGIFLMRQYMLSIPDSLIDAARIDGAGDFRIYWKLVIPLCKPIFVTLAIFTFVGTWNDFLWPLIVMTDDRMYTLPVAVANLSGEHVQDTELMMASSVLTILPVMMVFIVLQKYYIRGIMMGGVKG